MEEAKKSNLVFALDIGTRSIVGIVGETCGEKLKVLAVETAEHGGRTMIDGQIDNIQKVADLARTVTKRLEERLGVSLTQVCVAAAGRALQTEKGSYALELPAEQMIDEELIGRLEAGAVSQAEETLQQAEGDRKKMFLVGYTVSQYRLDHYPLTVLRDHKGQLAEVDVVATFLPGEVIESLYVTMRAAGLQITSMTLEPIAAMNSAIPAELRLLNLALVDIGAGTTDIAICRSGRGIPWQPLPVMRLQRRSCRRFWWIFPQQKRLSVICVRVGRSHIKIFWVSKTAFLMSSSWIRFRVRWSDWQKRLPIR